MCGCCRAGLCALQERLCVPHASRPPSDDSVQRVSTHRGQPAGARQTHCRLRTDQAPLRVQGRQPGNMDLPTRCGRDALSTLKRGIQNTWGFSGPDRTEQNKPNNF